MFSLLIVEDNAPLRKTLREMIANELPILSIEEAEDAREAIEKIDSHKPDLILMDIRLPGKSGLELTRDIKATYPWITIAILTAYDMPEYREAAFEFGADYFLVKGFLSSSNLIALIESALSEKS